MHYYGRGDFRRALDEFNVAKGGLPNDAWVWSVIGYVNWRLGNWDEVDAAFEKATGAFGKPVTVDLDTMDAIGTPVKKIGRTTGLQKGTIVAFGYGITSESEHIDRAVGREPANFYTDLLIAPREKGKVFSAGGDSGSAILIDDDRNRPIGLLWGGWPEDIGRGMEDLTYAIDLTRVLKTMELELV